MTVAKRWRRDVMSTARSLAQGDYQGAITASRRGRLRRT
jgi:hypothetical protein